MTERRGRKPPSSDPAASLSDEDVERRLGGDAGLGGPVPPRPPVADAGAPPPGPPPSRGRGLLWRDAGLAVALLAFLFLGARFALNWQPTGSQPTGSPVASEVALASEAPTPTVTETPAPTPSPTPFVVIPSVLPTETPVPTATPAAPTPTPVAGPTPTPRPGTATVKVSVLVAPPTYNGNDVSSDWTVTVKGAGATPSTFKGSSAGTTVRILAGQTFSVTTKAKTPNGYVQSSSGDCSGKASSGISLNCTFLETDKPAGVTITVQLNGANGNGAIDIAASNPFHCAVISASLCSIAADSTPRTVNFDSNSSFSVTAADQAGFTSAPSGACSGAGLAEGAIANCTITFTAKPPPGPVPAGAGWTWLGPLVVPSIRRRRSGWPEAAR